MLTKFNLLRYEQGQYAKLKPELPDVTSEKVCQKVDIYWALASTLKQSKYARKITFQKFT